MFSKEHKLFTILACLFITNALVAEIIGGKIFSLEGTLGFEKVNLSFFGFENLSFELTAGVLLWPVVFIMTDIINEYYGMQGVRFLSWMAAGLITFAFIAIFLAVKVVPAGWWEVQKDSGVDVNMNQAFRLVLTQTQWIIVGSIVAFLIGQFVDAYIFHWIKRKTGAGKIWMRTTGSTMVSQLIDSFVVLFIAFYIGANWPLGKVLAICFVNYIYKGIMAILLTPVIYFVHIVIDKYLGKEKSEEMMARAHGKIS